MNKNQTEGGFFSHLTELRKRLIHSLIFLSILFIICYYFSEYIYSFLVDSRYTGNDFILFHFRFDIA